MTYQSNNGVEQVYIGISGNIGAGKSVLTKHCEEDGYTRSKLLSLIRIPEHQTITTFHEIVLENRFLPRYYKDPERWALTTQIRFFTSRLKNQKGRDKKPGGVYIDDRIVWEDTIFAYVAIKKRRKDKQLGAEEFDVYKGIYDYFIDGLRLPDLTVYIDKSPEACSLGIKERGREFEKNMPLDYLQDLEEGYKNFFKDYPGRVITINGGIDLDTSKGALNGIVDRMVDEILKIRGEKQRSLIRNPQSLKNTRIC